MPTLFPFLSIAALFSSALSDLRQVSHIVDLAMSELLSLGGKGGKGGSKKINDGDVFNRIKGIVLRVIQPDTNPPSPLLRSVQETHIPSGHLSIPELRAHLQSLTAATLRLPVGFKTERAFKVWDIICTSAHCAQQ